MKGHLITLGLLACAICLYILGLALPATALVILGMLAELAFWLRLFHAKRK
jgi:hypothetical protein